MSATDDFNAFHEKRQVERGKALAERLTIRKATLPGEVKGYVLRRGDTEERAYIVRDPDGFGWDYGRLVGTELNHVSSALTKDVAIAEAGKLI